jgi:4'-phosphopantetheinyl transferase
MLDVVVARLNVGTSEVCAASALLSEDERRRANRFVFERDRSRFIVGRARLRQLLGARLEVAPASIEFAYGDRGKPTLSSVLAGSGLRFNISHCGDLAVYGFAWYRDIGIDVEAVAPIADAHAIASRFFSRCENEQYTALPPVTRPLGFFNCWTRKEAFIKALGDGLSCPLDSFDVSLAPGEPAKILRVGDQRGDECAWDMQNVSPGPGFVAAVVVERR